MRENSLPFATTRKLILHIASVALFIHRIINRIYLSHLSIVFITHVRLLRHVCRLQDAAGNYTVGKSSGVGGASFGNLQRQLGEAKKKYVIETSKVKCTVLNSIGLN